MRTYGRIKNPKAGKVSGAIGSFVIGVSAIGEATADQDLIWVEVDTDENGYNDAVMVTTLIQCLKLNLGESPFFANYGIPAKTSVMQQVAPDFYVVRTQRQFSQYFASLIIAKADAPEPTYQISVTTQQGSKIPTFGVAT